MKLDQAIFYVFIQARKYFDGSFLCDESFNGLTLPIVSGVNCVIISRNLIANVDDDTLTADSAEWLSTIVMRAIQDEESDKT